MIKRLLRKKSIKTILSMFLWGIILLTSTYVTKELFPLILSENKLYLACFSMLLLTAIISIVLFVNRIIICFALLNEFYMNKTSLAMIKELLSNEFEVVTARKNVSTKILGYDYFIDKDTFVNAKIDENNVIHLKVKIDDNTLFDAETTEYEWFYENFQIFSRKKTA